MASARGEVEWLVFETFRGEEECGEREDDKVKAADGTAKRATETEATGARNETKEDEALLSKNNLRPWNRKSKVRAN